VKLILVRLERRVKMQLRALRRKTKDKGLAIRCQIILLADKGRSRPDIAQSLGCSVSWVGRVLSRFRQCGIAGLHDRREDNGQVKLDECYLSLLYELVDQSPQDYGYRRPTWTRELLAKLMQEFTGTKVHPATMSRALKRIGARRGRPRPRVQCPWALGGRVVLHFLPPYCPDDNRIERVWLDLHANVTRNHRCQDMQELMREVTAYLAGRNRRKKAEPTKPAKAA
jgi:transposase